MGLMDGPFVLSNLHKFRYMLGRQKKTTLKRLPEYSIRKYVDMNQQEIVKSGSSETTRGAFKFSFNFTNFKKAAINYNNNYDDKFLEWFLGFFEALGRLSFFGNILCIKYNDDTVLEFIKNNLGFGKVVSGSFIILDHDIPMFFSLIQNNLLLEKSELLLQKFIQNNNVSGKRSIPFNMSLIKLLRETSWLSGFFSLEGCFNAQMYRSNHSYVFRARVVLDQKGESFLLNHIKIAIPGGLLRARSDKKNHRLVFMSNLSLTNLIKYFIENPLLSEKKLKTYNRWLYYLIESRKGDLDSNDLLVLGRTINKN
ncbi:hypothetical protein EON73_00815 [bacterium]|nr:MAG: hypothetical protein EON73_00815 [bacterium]